MTIDALCVHPPAADLAALGNHERLCTCLHHAVILSYYIYHMIYSHFLTEHLLNHDVSGQPRCAISAPRGAARRALHAAMRLSSVRQPGEGFAGCAPWGRAPSRAPSRPLRPWSSPIAQPRGFNLPCTRGVPERGCCAALGHSNRFANPHLQMCKGLPVCSEFRGV